MEFGFQTWMTENIRLKLPEGCYPPNNDIKNIGNYGYLYTWDQAQNVCPSGWHLPSLEEFEVLISYLGGDTSSVIQMKGIEGWNKETSSVYGSNISGFHALPAGMFYDGSMYDDSNHFEEFGESIGWWTSNQYAYLRAGLIGLINDEKCIAEGRPRKDNGYSVRCIKD